MSIAFCSSGCELSNVRLFTLLPLLITSFPTSELAAVKRERAGSSQMSGRSLEQVKTRSGRTSIRPGNKGGSDNYSFYRGHFAVRRGRGSSVIS